MLLNFSIQTLGIGLDCSELKTKDVFYSRHFPRTVLSMKFWYPNWILVNLAFSNNKFWVLEPLFAWADRYEMGDIQTRELF